jgi:cytochrome c553
MKLSFPALLVLMLTTGDIQAGGNPANGQKLALDCFDCHGEDGRGDDQIPQIAGLEEAYIVEQLMAFKSGDRIDENGIMPMYAEDLSKQEMADLAAYFASLGAD